MTRIGEYELRGLHLPSGFWYGLFLPAELAEMAQLQREIQQVYASGFAPSRYVLVDGGQIIAEQPETPADLQLLAAQLTNRIRRIEERARSRV